MDFVSLLYIIFGTLILPVYVNLTVGYKYQSHTSLDIVRKQEKSERFLATSQNAALIAWNPWSPWSVCSSSCREGAQARGRGCSSGVTSDCPGQNYEVAVCNLGPCSVWNPWSPWSVCSHTCGYGLRARGRSCQSGVISDCDGPYYEMDNCTLKSCSAWTTWSSWSACSHSCGGGFQTRDRMCNTGMNSHCDGHSYDIQECNAVPCDAIISATTTRERTSTHSTLAGMLTATTAPIKSITQPPPGGMWTAVTPPLSTSTLPPFTGTWTTTRMSPNITKLPSISCFACTGDPSDCEYTFQSVICSAPNNYCINDLTNNADASRVVIRRCGNYNECVNDWWDTYSDNERCKNFDQDVPYNLHFNCKFCCVKSGCNDRINPPKETYFVKN